MTTKDRSVLLEGPPGVGKTTVVYAVANDLGYDVVEMNASDARTESDIKKTLNNSVNSTNLMSYMKPSKDGSKSRAKKIIFIDEVDGISGRSDRGGLSTLLKILDKTQNPIIMAANFYDSKFKSLYNKTTKIKCNALKKSSIKNLLQRIAKNEGLEVRTKTLYKIAENSGGDLRSAINDLQGMAQGMNTIDSDEVDSYDMHRDIQEKIFSFIETMFKEKTLYGARNVASNADLDYNILHNVMFSNLSSYVHDPIDKANALLNIAKADDVMGKIKKDMDFSHLPYFFDLISGGVVLSVKFPDVSGYKRFKFPRFSGRSSSALESDVVLQLQEQYHMARTQIVKEVLPFMKDLVNNYPRSKKKRVITGFADEFGLSARKFRKYL